MNNETILLAHGVGGRLSNELINSVFVRHFANASLSELGDAAVFDAPGKRLCFSTDSFVVSPLEFPGGNIGSLAVHGTVNDLAMMGGRPLYLSAGFIIEEGFSLAELDRIVAAMAAAAKACGVAIVTGDTKVVARGAADKLFINTAGIGVIDYPSPLGPRQIQAGDAVIVNGPIGDHGAAIMSLRQGLGLESDVISDSAALNGLVQELLAVSPDVHCLRDATRGGLGTILAEIAEQSGQGIELEESAIPVRDAVRGLGEILGLDPLFMANEGKFAVICAAEAAESVLKVMHCHALGQDARLIGRVVDTSGRLTLKTLIGGQRVIDIPAGELLPRIC